MLIIKLGNGGILGNHLGGMVGVTSCVCDISGWCCALYNRVWNGLKAWKIRGECNGVSSGGVSGGDNCVEVGSEKLI